MNTFLWDEHFMTGLSEVDKQHRTLVDIINKISDCTLNNKKSFLKVNKLLEELMDYTVYHFNEEEKLAREANVDKRHQEGHIKEHTTFVERVVSLSGGIGVGKTEEIDFLLDFLINWLAYHILVTDKNLARQIKAIKSGVSPKEAYEIEEKKSNDSVKPLIATLNNLVNQVSQKNDELSMLNRSLETKVKERTEELVSLNTKLEKLSLTDELTNIPNRRLCMKVLNGFWDNAYKGKDVLSCIMLDVDHFKSVNDNYGHDAGDEVLRVLAQTFKHAIRNDDIVCRLGGDEFLIICLHTDLDGAMILAKGIYEKVNQLKIPTGSDFWHGSISIGVATKTKDMEHCEELIKAADTGVYAAKNDGKNCIKAV